MLFAQDFIANVIIGSNNNFIAYAAFICAALIVHFTNGFSCMYIISSTDGFATNLTLAAFWVIMFLCKFNSVSLDFLFTDATFILLFHETFLTIWFAIPFKEFSIYLLSATSAFKTFFVVKFSKCSAAFICYNFVTNATVTYCFIDCFCHSISNFCFNSRIIEIRIRRD